MIINEHERAVLTRDVPEKSLKAGDVGTVVSVHEAAESSAGSTNGESASGYTLEFMSPSGETIALATVFADAVRAARPREVNHARAI